MSLLILYSEIEQVTLPCYRQHCMMEDITQHGRVHSLNYLFHGRAYCSSLWVGRPKRDVRRRLRKQYSPSVCNHVNQLADFFQHWEEEEGWGQNQETLFSLKFLHLEAGRVENYCSATKEISLLFWMSPLTWRNKHWELKWSEKSMFINCMLISTSKRETLTNRHSGQFFFIPLILMAIMMARLYY